MLHCRQRQRRRRRRPTRGPHARTRRRRHPTGNARYISLLVTARSICVCFKSVFRFPVGFIVHMTRLTRPQVHELEKQITDHVLDWTRPPKSTAHTRTALHPRKTPHAQIQIMAAVAVAPNVAWVQISPSHNIHHQTFTTIYPRIIHTPRHSLKKLQLL
jgi:hypothetical protein